MASTPTIQSRVNLPDRTLRGGVQPAVASPRVWFLRPDFHLDQLSRPQHDAPSNGLLLRRARVTQNTPRNRRGMFERLIGDVLLLLPT